MNTLKPLLYTEEEAYVYEQTVKVPAWDIVEFIKRLEEIKQNSEGKFISIPTGSFIEINLYHKETDSELLYRLEAEENERRLLKEQRRKKWELLKLEFGE